MSVEASPGPELRYQARVSPRLDGEQTSWWNPQGKLPHHTHAADQLGHWQKNQGALEGQQADRAIEAHGLPLRLHSSQQAKKSPRGYP